MQHLFITALTSMGLLYSGYAMSATTLSDTELADVSGGGIDPHLEGQSLPQDQQQPESNNPGYMPPLQSQNSDGMDLTPELFAVLQSRIDMERERKLLLNGTTQQSAIALNLENTLSSDIVSTNNIFDGDSISPDDVTSEIEINQLNSLSQRHSTQGSLTSSIAGYSYEKSVENRSGSESYEYHAYSYIDQSRINDYQSIYTRNNHVNIGDRFTSLEDMKDGGIINNLQLAGLNLLKFQLKELNLGTGLAIKGSGSVIADSGKFNLGGYANVKICFIWCVNIKVKLITVNKELKVLDSTNIVPGDTGNTVDTADRDNNLIEEHKAIDVAESRFNESYEHSVFTGGQMAGAMTELLALSEGTLSVDNSSIVSLTESAQQNTRVFNMVNAASSIAANAQNISRLPTISTGSAAVLPTSLRQHNRFVQQR